MRRFRHGLLIGKFYPPHRGHHAAIREGAARCERFTVVVMSSARESIPLADRVAWLRAEHADDPNVRVTGIPCDAPMDIDDPQVWLAQVATMRAAIEHDDAAAPPVDAVVSHDTYGEQLASWFDATWLQLQRPAGEPSGSALRRDLAATWDHLAPATKAGLATRVVVLGAESTGTTTVARALTEHVQGRGGVWTRTICVEEYGREYTEMKWTAAHHHSDAVPALDEIAWRTNDFDAVAAEQTRRENAAARDGSPLLVCDTDAFATAVWERRYLAAAARPHPAYAAAPALPTHHVYLLTHHDGVPWTDDGMREGDLEIRTVMTDWFIGALTAAGHSWVLLTGTQEQRIALATRTTDQLLEHRLRFADPLYGPGFAPPVRTTA